MPETSTLNHFASWHGADMAKAIGDAPTNLAKIAAFGAPEEDDQSAIDSIHKAMEQAFLAGAIAEKANPCPL